MREPTKDNDAGRLLLAVVLTDGEASVEGLVVLMNPPPRVRLSSPPLPWANNYRAWKRRHVGDMAYCGHLLADLIGGGYITADIWPNATDKGRALVDGWK